MPARENVSPKPTVPNAAAPAQQRQWQLPAQWQEQRQQPQQPQKPAPPQPLPELQELPPREQQI
jgi:hypothetical protein